MSENRIHSQPASAGNGIVEGIRKTIRFLMNEFDILEMPLRDPKMSVRMELAELKRFRRGNGMPLFCLKVEETVHDGVPFPVQTPYHKYFTVYRDWCFYAVERIPKQDDLARKEVN